MIDPIKLAEQIEQTTQGTQFQPDLTDEEWLLIAKSLRSTRPEERKPVAWRREWDGDDSDIGAWVYASSRDELDEYGPWQPLYAEL